MKPYYEDGARAVEDTDVCPRYDARSLGCGCWKCAGRTPDQTLHGEPLDPCECGYGLASRQRADACPWPR